MIRYLFKISLIRIMKTPGPTGDQMVSPSTQTILKCIERSLPLIPFLNVDPEVCTSQVQLCEKFPFCHNIQQVPNQREWIHIEHRDIGHMRSLSPPSFFFLNNMGAACGGLAGHINPLFSSVHSARLMEYNYPFSSGISSVPQSVAWWGDSISAFSSSNTWFKSRYSGNPTQVLLGRTQSFWEKKMVGALNLTCS